jgi:epoxyqueuosine reductase
MGLWIYGCDVCQQVCPWQRFAHRTEERVFLAEDPKRAAPRLVDLMELGEESFRHRYQGTPIHRIKRRRLLRNVAVALGNGGDEQAVPSLARALTDPEPLIRGHAAWALGRIGGRKARSALADALRREKESYVRGETEAALREDTG